MNVWPATAKSIAMLEKLVSFDTVSRNSNLAFIDFVQGLLKEHGIESRLVHNDDRTKANLLATIGPRIEGCRFENTGDDDWTNVNMCLMSGRPVSFIQDLYEPLYVQRPFASRTYRSPVRVHGPWNVARLRSRWFQ